MNGKEKDGGVSARVVKALKARQKWENKEEFLDIIYWMRQCMSIAVGLVWGIIPLQGYIGLLSFFAVNIGLVYLYHSFYQQVDSEEYGGIWELVKEGMMGSFALFLVSWIMTYSCLHF